MAKKRHPKKESLEKAEVKKVNLLAGLKKKQVIIATSVVVFALVFLFVKNWLLVVSVNNELITRPALISKLEKRYGKQTLDSLITETLILQEQKKNKIEVSDQEVNDYLAKIKEDISKSGQNIEDILQMQGMTEADLFDQIKVQKVIEKILSDKIKVTDEELANSLASKSSGEKSEPTEEEKENRKEQLKQQKLGTEFDAWLKSLKEEAKIKTFVTF